MLANFAGNVWRALVEAYTEFSRESTIHGIKYTTQAKSTVERLVWLGIVIACLLCAVQLMSLFYERHESASMSTLIISNQYPTWKLPLPAVTLCPGTLVAAQKVLPYITSQKRIYLPRGLTHEDFQQALKYLREVVFPTDHFTDEMERLQQILSANRMSILELLEQVSPNCSDFLIMCRFEEQTVPCNAIMEEVATPYGICCSFNYENGDSTRRESKVMKEQSSINFGAHYIASFLMRTHPPEERLSSTLYGDGIRVLVHERFSYPSVMSLNFVVPAGGYETKARLYGRYLTSSNEILALPPKVRKCSFSKGTYSVTNCYVKCREDAIRKFCGCVPFSASIESGQQMCSLMHISCLARYTFHIESVKPHDERCSCYPDCESTTFTATVTTLPLNAAQYHPGDFYKKAFEVRNATALHITFAGQSAVLQRRELMLSTINLVSSLGGIFSLFLGCSFISGFEILYFLIICFVRKLKDMQKPQSSGDT